MAVLSFSSDVIWSMVLSLLVLVPVREHSKHIGMLLALPCHQDGIKIWSLLAAVLHEFFLEICGPTGSN